MPSRKDLPFLLKLLDDESSEVRREVSQELTEFGEDLADLVAPSLSTLSSLQRKAIEEILEQVEGIGAEQYDFSWLDLQGYRGLETILGHLSEMFDGQKAIYLSVHLDELACRFLKKYPQGNSQDLMSFLFGQEGFEALGETNTNFEHHFLSNLLANKSGSTLCVAALAMLVGGRIGLSMYSINVQGHYMAMAVNEVKLEMYNPMEGGKPHHRSTALYMEEAIRRNLTWPQEMQIRASEIALTILRSAIKGLYDSGQNLKAKRFNTYYRHLLHELNRRGW